MRRRPLCPGILYQFFAAVFNNWCQIFSAQISPLQTYRTPPPPPPPRYLKRQTPPQAHLRTISPGSRVPDGGMNHNAPLFSAPPPGRNGLMAIAHNVHPGAEAAAAPVMMLRLA